MSAISTEYSFQHWLDTYIYLLWWDSVLIFKNQIYHILIFETILFSKKALYDFIVQIIFLKEI
jgi:hypothetical protein